MVRRHNETCLFSSLIQTHPGGGQSQSRSRIPGNRFGEYHHSGTSIPDQGTTFRNSSIDMIFVSHNIYNAPNIQVESPVQGTTEQSCIPIHPQELLGALTERCGPKPFSGTSCHDDDIFNHIHDSP